MKCKDIRTNILLNGNTYYVIPTSMERVMQFTLEEFYFKKVKEDIWFVKKMGGNKPNMVIKITESTLRKYPCLETNLNKLKKEKIAKFGKESWVI